MTGSEVPGKASLGSWLAYGLGSESQNLPAFVVLTPTWSAKCAGTGTLHAHVEQWLPADALQRCSLRSAGDPVLYLQNQQVSAARIDVRCSTRLVN